MLHVVAEVRGGDGFGRERDGRQHVERLDAEGARRAEVSEVDAALAGDWGPAVFEEAGEDVGVFDFEEEVDDGIALLEVVDGALVADHAAHHGDEEIGTRALGVFEQGKLAVGALLGLFADTARVEHDEIGGVYAGGFVPAEAVEDAGDALGVGLVHLAADGPDVVFAAGDAHR